MPCWPNFNQNDAAVFGGALNVSVSAYYGSYELVINTRTITQCSANCVHLWTHICAYLWMHMRIPVGIYVHTCGCMCALFALCACVVYVLSTLLESAFRRFQSVKRLRCLCRWCCGMGVSLSLRIPYVFADLPLCLHCPFMYVYSMGIICDRLATDRW